jgi:large subunit ribosomal protein L25
MLELKAKKRIGKPQKNYIAGVVYGSGSENISLQVEKLNFEKIFKQAGEATLIDLIIEGGDKFKVLIKDIQQDPVKDNIIHIDLFKVDMNKEITAEIPFVFVGESKAVKELNGVINKSMDGVEVECLPGELVGHIDVDLSALKSFDDTIKIKDLICPKGIVIKDDPENVVASVSEAKEDVVEAPKAEAEKEAEPAKAGDKDATTVEKK